MKTAKVNRIISCTLTALLLGVASAGWTQSRFEESVRRADETLRSSMATPTTSEAGSQERGVAASDYITGNGARAGYTLTHGGIIAGSESVTVDGSLLQRNKGYFLDVNSGTLAFAEPVRMNQTIRVTYRYSPERNKQRTTLGAPSFALNLGANTSLGLTFAQNVTPNQAYDMTTYGVNLQTEVTEHYKMSNMMFISSAQETGRVTPSMLRDGGSQSAAPKPKSDNLFIHNSDLSLGEVNVKLNYQDVGQHFSGFNAMRQQNSAPAAMIAQLEKEKGLRRFGVQADYAMSEGTSTSLGWSRIGETNAEIVRQSLSLKTSSGSISAEIRDIDENFSKMKALTPDEQKAFGKEIGMKRITVAGDMKLSSEVDVKASYASVEDKDGDVVKYGVAVKGKNFDVAANFQEIDPEFKRINDLNDADKKTMNEEHGMKRYDLTTSFRPSDVIKIDSFVYNARHSLTDNFKKQLRNNIVIQGKNTPKLSLFFDDVNSGKPDAISKFSRQRYTLDHSMGMFKFNVMQDNVERENALGEERKTETTRFRFNTDNKKRTSMIGDWRNIRHSDGRFEETTMLKMNTQLTSKLKADAMRLTVDTEENETVTNEYNLTGNVFGNVALRSKFAETLVDGETVGNIRELSLIPGGAKDYGPLKQFKWTVGFAEARNAVKIQTRSKTASLDTQLLGHHLVAGYSGVITKEGQTPVVRSIAVTGDKNPKNRLQYSLSYRVHDNGNSPNMYIRRYDASYKFNDKTNLVYHYLSHDMKANGKIEPIGIERLRLTTLLNNKLSVTGQWENREDYAKNIDRNTFSLGFAGKISALTAVEASYGYDKVTTPSGKRTSRTYRLSYDHQVSADQFLTLSGKYTDWSGSRPSNVSEDDVKVQLDVRQLFN